MNTTSIGLAPSPSGPQRNFVVLLRGSSDRECPPTRSEVGERPNTQPRAFRSADGTRPPPKHHTQRSARAMSARMNAVARSTIVTPRKGPPPYTSPTAATRARATVGFGIHGNRRSSQARPRSSVENGAMAVDHCSRAGLSRGRRSRIRHRGRALVCEAATSSQPLSLPPLLPGR